MTIELCASCLKEGKLCAEEDMTVTFSGDKVSACTAYALQTMCDACMWKKCKAGEQIFGVGKPVPVCASFIAKEKPEEPICSTSCNGKFYPDTLKVGATCAGYENCMELVEVPEDLKLLKIESLCKTCQKVKTCPAVWSVKDKCDAYVEYKR